MGVDIHGNQVVTVPAGRKMVAAGGRRVFSLDPALPNDDVSRTNPVRICK
jgi:hypothetical protein